MRNLLKGNCNQMWFNAQNMDKAERKATIKYIIGLSKTKGSFVEYAAKYYMAKLIHLSEVCRNNIGTQTRVQEFDKIGWYDENDNLIFDKIMN
jgi:hypothetical protein